MQAQAMNSTMRAAVPPSAIQGGQPSRLDRWLGEPGVASQFVTITEEMLRKLTPEQLFAITQKNLPILGAQARDLFVSKLPEAHKLQVPDRLGGTPLKKAPHLGSCKIGHVVLGRDGDRVHLNEIFMSTFDADIDLTDGSGDYFKLKDKQVSNDPRMIYGVHTICRVETVAGKSRLTPVTFNTKAGDRGVAFSTSNKVEAFYNIVAASTGRSIDEVKAMAAKAKARA
jgi:hypothetical protein